MGLLEDELEEVTRLCPRRIVGSRLITCINGLVRVEISKTKVQTLLAALRFPVTYPKAHLLVELRSKTLGDNFLAGLTNLCEDEAKKFLGKPQVIIVLEFIRKFIDEHPLCCCSEEISIIRRDLLKTRPLDELKLKQKTSSLTLTIKPEEYTHKVHIQVPENYPDSQVRLEIKHSSFSDVFQRYFNGQGTEIARRCVEPPLNKKNIPKNATFQPKPSLLPVVKFLVEQVHRCAQETCAKCGIRCFPQNPTEVIMDENHDFHVERVYCGHQYHLKCLVDYMKTPPFTGGKKCLGCSKQIFHEKYKLSAEVSESRWAHKEAREREFEEVAEFLSGS